MTNLHLSLRGRSPKQSRLGKQFVVEITPRGIKRSDESQLLGPRSCLYLLLALNRCHRVIGNLVVDEDRRVVPLREAVVDLLFVLLDPGQEVVGHTCVQDRTSWVRQNVNV